MAKGDKNNTEKPFNAVAKHYIKYDGEHLKPEDKFSVKESDVEELKNYAEIEIPEETNTPSANTGSGQG